MDRLPRLKRAGAAILYELTVSKTPMPPDVFLADQRLFTVFFTDEGKPMPLGGDEYTSFRRAFDKKDISDPNREPFLANVWVESRLGPKATPPEKPLELASVGKAIDDMVKPTILSDPSMASVYLRTDLNLVGSSPDTEWVFPGRITVIVKKAGFAEDAQGLDLTDDYVHKVALKKR